MPKGRPGPDPKNIPPHIGGSSCARRRYRDLCSTCNHAKACGDRSTVERPIFFCEEFEAFVPVSTILPTSTAPQEPASKQRESLHKGLCVNCENRESCTMHRPEGGTWHCEEYR